MNNRAPNNHILLIANRGEIAVRVIHTAKKLGIRTISVYTPADALAPHVTLADISVPLLLLAPTNTSNISDTDTETATVAKEGRAYLDTSALLEICRSHRVTLLHPGYGFLSENASFAREVTDIGVMWLGPSPECIRLMGVKHEARRMVREVRAANTSSSTISNTSATGLQLDVVPGSEGLVRNVDEAVDVVERVTGLPVVLKPSAGGGGLGMVVCETLEEVRAKFENAGARAESLFGDGGIFIEKYVPKARHVEIQVFGDGEGNVVHMSERECSTQRRHQKIIEESPSPFLEAHPGLREKICDAAITLCSSIKYESAGTVEFLVDEETGPFYFLEMNTRIQVEHPVTEAVHEGLDLIELMIKHGIARRDGTNSDVDMKQATYDELRREAKEKGRGYAIEGRVYAENPAEGFLPSPGLLQHVVLPEEYPWLRIDSWISTGVQITPHFDPLLCKIIVQGGTREEAISRFLQALEECKIHGPPNNVEYLRAIATSLTFGEGKITTRFLDRFQYTSRAMKVIMSGIEMTIQDLPGRMIGKGIPRSGPMDPMAFSVGNILVGNDETTEGVEIIVVPGVPSCFQFLCPAVVAITGREVEASVDGGSVGMWSRLIIPAGGKLELQVRSGEEKPGLRVYLLVRGGFPRVPQYLGSKSTSMGLGGYQGRALIVGDSLELGDCEPNGSDLAFTLPREMIPQYPKDWIVYVLSGPQDDEEFVTKEGIAKFYRTHWSISPSSNRMGIRLGSPEKIEWGRDSGGEGGAHPSNILDNGYAFGSVNVNGDTPVILTSEGPDMGGYLCICTVASAELWKLGQLGPGNSVQFRRISYDTARELSNHNRTWMASVSGVVAEEKKCSDSRLYGEDIGDQQYGPKLYQKPEGADFVLRQAGDSAILAEFGTMELDFFVRAKIQAFTNSLQSADIAGLRSVCPCIRSLMCHYDNSDISQIQLVEILIVTEKNLPTDLTDMTFLGRRITFPIVLDDPWSKEATERYARAIRNKAVYLPSNVEYLARNNGLSGATEALTKLVASDWMVFGVGFYLACPFLVPIDPRSRLTGQKLNPSRTFTPRGAVGIAGPVAAIYPIDSPGGYQLFGRSLPTWQTWGKGRDFVPGKPWLLESFDQVRFEVVNVDSYLELAKRFDQGHYVFKIEPTLFSMREYVEFLRPIQEEIREFKRQQKTSSEIEGQRERNLLLEWEGRREQQVVRSLEVGDEGLKNAETIRAPLFASIWKILCRVGDVIVSVDDTLFVLEAMKTEIPVRPSVEHVGKTIKGWGHGVREGTHVKPGETLVIIA